MLLFFVLLRVFIFARMNKIQQALVSLTNAALFHNEAVLPDNFRGKDYPKLYTCAKKNGVLALCLDGILQLPAGQQPPKELKLQWAANVISIEKNYDRKQQALDKLTDIFRAENIPCLVFKGFALSRLYPQPKHREFGDLDIFLPKHYDKGNIAMEKQGIHVHSGHHHTQFHINRVLVENHSAFLHDSHSSTERRLEFSAENEQETHPGQYPLYFPSLHQAVHFADHTAQHFFSNDCNIRLRTLCDWALILRDEGRDWEYTELKAWLAHSEAGHLADMMTAVCTEWFGCTLSKKERHYVKPFSSRTRRRFTEAVFAKKYSKKDEPRRLVRYAAHLCKYFRFSKMRKKIAR